MVTSTSVGFSFPEGLVLFGCSSPKSSFCGVLHREHFSLSFGFTSVLKAEFHSTFCLLEGLVHTCNRAGPLVTRFPPRSDLSALVICSTIRDSALPRERHLQKQQGPRAHRPWPRSTNAAVSGSKLSPLRTSRWNMAMSAEIGRLTWAFRCSACTAEDVLFLLCSLTSFARSSLRSFLHFSTCASVVRRRRPPPLKAVLRSCYTSFRGLQRKDVLGLATSMATAPLQNIPVLLACTRTYWRWVPVCRRLGGCESQRWWVDKAQERQCGGMYDCNFLATLPQGLRPASCFVLAENDHRSVRHTAPNVMLPTLPARCFESTTKRSVFLWIANDGISPLHSAMLTVATDDKHAQCWPAVYTGSF